MLLTEAEQTTLLKLAKDSVQIASPAAMVPEKMTSRLKEPLPCFVTLLTKRNQLRGCIGCMQTDSPLYQNVAEYACHAAFRDPRFPPVQGPEINQLKFEISVLGPLKPLKNLDSIEIGKHGLRVDDGSQSGVLLAKVATQHQWTRKEFQEHTCLKADLDSKQADTYRWSYFEEFSFGE